MVIVMELINRDRLLKQVHSIMKVDGSFAYVVYAEDVEKRASH